MTEKVSIAVLIPTKGKMFTKTVESLIGLLFHNNNKGIATGIIFAEGTLLTTVRSRLIDEFMKKDYTHLFFIDSDMTFPVDMVEKLLNTKKSVACAIAKVRGGKHWNIFKRDFASTKYIPYEDVGEDLMKIDATGCSCILIEREVIAEILESKRLATGEWKALDEQYTGNNMIIKETLNNLSKDRFLFNAIGEKSEDVIMCEYIKSCGYSIWADCSLKLGHINDIEIK